MSDRITAQYRSGEYACTAYVTFKDAYALETAVMLSVSFIHPVSRGSNVCDWNLDLGFVKGF